MTRKMHSVPSHGLLLWTLPRFPGYPLDLESLFATEERAEKGMKEGKENKR